MTRTGEVNLGAAFDAFRDYLDLTLVALAVVGLMKLELRPEGLALLRPPPEPFVLVLAPDDAGDILLRLF